MFKPFQMFRPSTAYVVDRVVNIAIKVSLSLVSAILLE